MRAVDQGSLCEEIAEDPACLQGRPGQPLRILFAVEIGRLEQAAPGQAVVAGRARADAQGDEQLRPLLERRRGGIAEPEAVSIRTTAPLTLDST